MNRSFVSAVVLALVVASQASAAINGVLDVNDNLRISVINNSVTGASGGGGPFKLEFFDDSTTGASNVSTPIGTRTGFCVEFSQHFSSGGVYDITGLNNSSSTTPKTLTGYAAWAFSKLATLEAANGGAVNFRNVVIPSLVSTDLLFKQLVGIQKAIWAGMYDPTASLTAQAGSAAANSEAGVINTNTDTYIVAAGLTWNTFTNASTIWGSSSAVIDKQNYKGSAEIVQIGSAQDQLFLSSGNLALVPEPASLVVWSLLAGGAAGLSVIRKRRGLPRGRWSNDSRNAILAVVGANDHHE